MFMEPGEPAGLIVAAALGRWAYRHRSAFLPFVITGAAVIAADVIRRHHPGAWIAAVTVTAAVTIVAGIPHRILWARPAGRITAGILARAWEACGIDRPAERAYATAVIAVTGGWLSAAIAIGPATKPLPAVAAIATLILGIPWWAHRRRRARVRAERTIQAWPTIADDIGLPGSKIASVVVDAWGWTARVILRKGTTTEQAISKIPAIESGLGLRPGSVRVFPDQARADRFIVRVIENDPHAEPAMWPGSSVTSVARQVDIGISEDGRPVRVVILRRNVLIGGTTGSGKSGILNVIIASLAVCRDVVLWGVDLKGGMELQPWAACFDRLATTPQEANELFKDAVGWLNRRAREKARQGKRVLDPSPEDPALIIIVDEYAELPEESHDCADSIARRGRAVAVNLIAATQRPTQAAMGKDTAVRSQMDVRICLRVRERRDVDLILGQGSFNSGWRAHQLTQPGAFLISDPEHTAPERHRAYLLTDERIARHAAQHARGRPALPAGEPDMPQTAPGSPQTGERGPARGDDYGGPETALWGALADAGPSGVAVAELLAVTGMTRPTLYRHLRAHAKAGRAVQVGRGYWRAIGPPEGLPGVSRPTPRPSSPKRPGTPPRRDGRRPPGRDGQ
jgi:S-DNA-T family DNA segregation ATPase FtsK/SpoIIIE